MHESHVGRSVGHNYIGYNYISHNYIGNKYINHNYIGYNYIGHEYIGHNYFPRVIKNRGPPLSLRLSTATRTLVSRPFP